MWRNYKALNQFGIIGAHAPYIRNMKAGNPLNGWAMNGGRVSETTSPLITHNTLIFLRCSYVGSNGSCPLACCRYDFTKIVSIRLFLISKSFIQSKTQIKLCKVPCSVLAATLYCYEIILLYLHFTYILIPFGFINHKAPDELL